ncbi:MAG: SPFH domain-containing protein [Thermoguttaceae bacterium]
MSGLILGIIMLVVSAGAAAVGKRARPAPAAVGGTTALVTSAMRWAPSVLSAVAGLFALWLLLETSFVIIDADEVGHLNRIYWGSPMPPGQVVALKGQAGPQAEVLPPGFHIKPFLNVLYDVEAWPVVEIRTDNYGFLVARDGAPLRPGQILADRWSDDEFTKMLDAEYFLAGRGQKGPQLSVLPPGKWRLNRYLFGVVIEPATNIGIGTVGVVKSNVQEIEDCHPDRARDKNHLIVPLVPKGCIGVWNSSLSPGRYYLNARAYEVSVISTRAHSWVYSGGFQRRLIELTVDQEGRITQRERTEKVPVPAGAADTAIHVRVEGWAVPIGIRVMVQVAPEDAPVVIASVGGLEEVEDRILTPAIRSVVRNVVGAKGRKILELQEQRAELESLVEQAIVPEGRKAGISVKEVRFGDPVIPPELLVTLVRRQLAQELERTYSQEQRAQEQRILTEKSRATADQQDQLVAAQVGVQIEEQNKLASKLRGEGREAEMTAIARGQQAQVQILGKSRVLQLETLQKVLEAASRNPAIVKVPAIMVQGSPTGLEGFAAVLGGASNLAQGSLLAGTGRAEGIPE